MGSPQDIFGSSPKTVLNKPFFQAQWQLPTGTNVSMVVGLNIAEINSVLINDIAGSSLNPDGTIVLPAGKYYIEGTQKGRVYNTQEDQINIIVDGTKVVQGVTGQTTVTSSSFLAHKVAGQITLNSSSSVGIAIDHAGGTGTTGDHDIDPYEVFADIRIWKLDASYETPVVSDPTMTLTRPLLHVQDQKPTGTSGGASVTGINDRDLNSILTNEITGASLSSNLVTLPAGKYYIEAVAPTYQVNQTYTQVRKSDETVLLAGMNRHDSTDGGAAPMSAGIVVLTETTTLKVVSSCALTVANYGLGVLTSQVPHEVYADLKIWQLDAVVQTPVLVNDKLYPLPGSTMVTGNMHGLNYAKTGDNQVTVQAGICMDSTNNVILNLPAQQAVSIDSEINWIYNLFLCDDGVVRTDSDVDGANLSAYSIRWIGFVRTTSSGVIVDFFMRDNMMNFTTASENLVGNIGTSFATMDHSPWIPESRISAIEYGAQRPESTATSVWATDGTPSASFYIAQIYTVTADDNSGCWGLGSAQKGSMKPYNPVRMFKATNASDLLIQAVKMRR